MAELFGVDARTVNEYLQNIFKTKELEEAAVIRKIRIVPGATV
jgi:protein-arginine kinase activator protein McsA